MGIKDDMSKMFKALTGGSSEDVATDAPVTDMVVTESVVTDAPTTDLPDEFGTEAPVTDVISTDAPTTEVPKDPDIELRAKLERLEAELKEFKEGKHTDKTPVTEAPTPDEDFVGDFDLDDLSRDPDALNKLLNTVYQKGIEAAKKTSSQTLSNLPGMIKENISIIQTLEQTSKEFYSKYKELEPYKDVVATTFGEIASKNPDKTYQENLELVGQEVRKKLGIKAGEVINRDKSPNLPRPGKQQRPNQKPEPSGFDAELEAMEKALNS